MTEIIIAVLAAVAVAAYILAIVVLAVDEALEKAALARMVAGVAHLNPGTHPQCDGSPS